MDQALPGRCVEVTVVGTGARARGAIKSVLGPIEHGSTVVAVELCDGTVGTIAPLPVAASSLKLLHTDAGCQTRGMLTQPAQPAVPQDAARHAARTHSLSPAAAPWPSLGQAGTHAAGPDGGEQAEPPDEPANLMQIACTGEHIAIGTIVEVQPLGEVRLERGRVAEVLERGAYSQPLVRLVTGTLGAVFLVQSPGLPPHEETLALLTRGTDVIVEPLGTGVATAAALRSVLSSAPGAIVVEARAPPPTGDVTARLIAFLVPCIPGRSEAASWTGQPPALTDAVLACERCPEGSSATGGVLGSPVGAEDGWSESQQSELAQARFWEEALAPKLLELQRACATSRLDYNAAEMLAMLSDGASGAEIIKALAGYPDNLEAAANALLSHEASGVAAAEAPSPACSPAGSPQAPPNASRRRRTRAPKASTKQLDGCFAAGARAAGATPSPSSLPQRSLAEIVRLSADGTSGPSSPSGRPSSVSERDGFLPTRLAPADRAFDDELPDFLLPFVAEHVDAVQAATAARGGARDSSGKPRWVKVEAKRASPDKSKPGLLRSHVTLYSLDFRCAPVSSISDLMMSDTWHTGPNISMHGLPYAPATCL